jgi:hydroxymethylpyrimidine pyrophosphatase-like HAD family hydrolase
MKLAAVAIDYDGTIAVDGAFDPGARDAIAQLRLHGMAVILVTGRRLDDLKQVAGNLRCFSAIVAENGAVLYFPETGRHAIIGHAPGKALIDALQRRGIDITAGDSVIETDATRAASVLDVIRALEQPQILAFNRSRLMVLPPGIAKSIGLRRVLSTLRLSIHNTIGIGDAENDHDLLDACEVGVAVQWGSPALRVVADEVIPGTGPADVTPYLEGLTCRLRLSSKQMGRRRLLLGHRHDGHPLHLAIRGRTVLIAGEPGSGKSWLAGLLCEQLILQGYCLCIIDPEGDYRSLESLPGVVLMGGDDPPPRARELTQALRYPDTSLVIDLSKLSHADKQEYLLELLPLLATLRRQSGLPHKILIDEAHYYLAGPDGSSLVDAELAGYILVTFRVSGLDPHVCATGDTVVIVTRESDPQEQATLRGLCDGSALGVPEEVFRDLSLSEAALLPGAEESHGAIRRFQIAPRLTSHVRHRTKYFDMPIGEPQAFVFTQDGRPGPRARTLKDFVELLARLADAELLPHVRRHDFSRWLEHVFRDCPLATHVRAIENRVATDRLRDLVNDVVQAVRARYEMTPLIKIETSSHTDPSTREACPDCLRSRSCRRPA